jgi:hypothetical protein
VRAFADGVGVTAEPAVESSESTQLWRGIDGRRLAGWLERLPGSDLVDLRFGERWLECRCGKSRVRLAYGGPEGGWLLPQSPGGISEQVLKVPAEELRLAANLLLGVFPAKPGYHAPAAALMEVSTGGAVRFHATDGHRLAHLALGQWDADDPTGPGVVVGKGWLEAVAHACAYRGNGNGDGDGSELVLAVTAEQLHLRLPGAWELVGARTVQPFPDVHRVLESLPEVNVMVDAEALAKAIRFASVAATNVALEVNPENKLLTVSSAANAAEWEYADTAEQTVELLECSEGAPPEKAVFNSRYLLHGLSGIRSDAVMLGYRERLTGRWELAPHGDMCRDGAVWDYRYLVMPVAVNG